MQPYLKNDMHSEFMNQMFYANPPCKGKQDKITRVEDNTYKPLDIYIYIYYLQAY